MDTVFRWLSACHRMDRGGRILSDWEVVLMMATVIIIGLVALYACYVIVRKIKNIKAGKFCGCGCDGCSGCSGTKKKKEI